MSDFGVSFLPLARQDYQCLWCEEVIPKSALHFHYVGKWEGDFQDWRMHPECYADCTTEDRLEDGIYLGEGSRPASWMDIPLPQIRTAVMAFRGCTTNQNAELFTYLEGVVALKMLEAD